MSDHQRMSLPMIGINTEHMPLAEVLNQHQTFKDNILGLVSFAESFPTENVESNLPTVHLTATILEGDAFSCEVWLSKTDSVLTSGSQGAIQYKCNNELLFGVINLDELAVWQNQSEQNTENISPLQMATEAAYRQIFALIDELGYSHLYRFWNYIADINGNSHGLERYRQFNVGRKKVFMDSNREIGDRLPAACALGLNEGPLSIAFLVGKTPAISIENPRQISAYEYPEHYGPRTPSFSRATLLNTKQEAILFISGTASIVGHKTMHPLDVIAQTKETLANLEAVIAEANRILGEPKLSLDETFLRVYIRNAVDLPLVRAEIQRHIGGSIKAVYIQADICRAELLLEIEATIQSVAESS
jgi:chorismate lyase / 3-hydroxybenzoate synthase